MMMMIQVAHHKFSSYDKSRVAMKRPESEVKLPASGGARSSKSDTQSRSGPPGSWSSIVISISALISLVLIGLDWQVTRCQATGIITPDGKLSELLPVVRQQHPVPASMPNQDGDKPGKLTRVARSAPAMETWQGDSTPELARDSTEVSAMGNELGQPAVGPNENRKLRIIRMFAPDSIQNGTQNVTLDCMFRFDPKLDQRLIVKWYFENDLEPVYQWIPELNKRVFSDRYDKWLDKSYDLSEDVEFLLESHRLMQLQQQQQQQQVHSNGKPGTISRSPEVGQQVASSGMKVNDLPALDLEEAQLRNSLAHRLNGLAKLGGPKSRQLLDLLRHSLHLNPLHLSRYRALRLRLPTSELSGKFSCEVQSLEGQDSAQRKLTIYEPARKFDFQVRRVALEGGNGGQTVYNLSCSAERVFPRPTMQMFRHFGPLPTTSTTRTPPATHQTNGNLHQSRQPGGAGKLVASAHLKREPLVLQSELRVSLSSSNNQLINKDKDQQQQQQLDVVTQQVPLYDIATWALVEEASLNLAGNQHSGQFECLMQVPNTDYELRKSLTIHKGWQVNSAALVSRSTLLNLFTTLASILALALALVSGLFLVRLLRGQRLRSSVKRARIHQQQQNEANSSGSPSSSSSVSASPEMGSKMLKEPGDGALASQPGDGQRVVSTISGTYVGLSQQLGPLQATKSQQQQPPLKDRGLEQSADDSEGVYRVPVRARLQQQVQVHHQPQQQVDLNNNNNNNSANFLSSRNELGLAAAGQQWAPCSFGSSVPYYVTSGQNEARQFMQQRNANLSLIYGNNNNNNKRSPILLLTGGGNHDDETLAGSGNKSPTFC